MGGLIGVWNGLLRKYGAALIIGAFTAGVIWGDLNWKQSRADEVNKSQDERLDEHEDKFDEIEDKLGDLSEGQAVLKESAKNTNELVKRIYDKLERQ